MKIRGIAMETNWNKIGFFIIISVQIIHFNNADVIFLNHKHFNTRQTHLL